MGKQSACNTCPECTKHESRHFCFSGLDCHGFRGSLIIPDGIQCFSHDRCHKIMDYPDGEHGPDEYDGQGCIIGLSSHSSGTADDIEIFHGTLYNKHECKGYNCQIITPGSKGRDSHKKRAKSCCKSTCQQGKWKKPGA